MAWDRLSLRHFLDNGDIANIRRWIARHKRHLEMPDEHKNTALAFALKNGCPEEVFDLFIAAGANVNVNVAGVPVWCDKMPLIFYVFHFYPRSILKFLEAAVDPRITTANGRTILMEALRWTSPFYTPVIDRLIEDGADVNARDTTQEKLSVLEHMLVDCHEPSSTMAINHDRLKKLISAGLDLSIPIRMPSDLENGMRIAVVVAVATQPLLNLCIRYVYNNLENFKEEHIRRLPQDLIDRLLLHWERRREIENGPVKPLFIRLQVI